MLLRLTYLSVTNAFALLRLLPMSDWNKDVETLALRHQITILERQPGNAHPRFSPGDRHSSRHCRTDFRSTRFVGSDRWCVQRQCCGGTGTSSHNTTRSDPAPSSPADHGPSAPSGSSCCAEPTLARDWSGPIAQCSPRWCADSPGHCASID